MKKIAVLLSVLMLLLLCGCQEKASASPDPEKSERTTPEVSVVVPEGEVDLSQSENDASNIQNVTQNSQTYIANKSSKKFHRFDCQFGQKTSAQNVMMSNDRQELINAGYLPCKYCNP